MVTAKRPRRATLTEQEAQRRVEEVAEASARVVSELTQANLALLARCDALATALRRVLDTIPHEFAKPETQATRMAARALLVEVGR